MFVRYVIALCALGLSFGANAKIVSHYELNVGDFSELKVADGINVDYRCNPDSNGIVTFDATSDIASVITFTNNKKRLEIELSPEGTETKGLPTVIVYSQFLTKVENYGDSSVRVLSVTSGPDFKARLIGNGRLVVRNVSASQVDASINTGNGLLVIYGKCTTAKFNNTGTGNIQADDLVAQKVKCVQVGTGSIGCSASEELVIYGASGSVYYKGNPEIKNRAIKVKAIEIDTEK